MTQDKSSIELESIGKCYRIFANPQDRFKQALRERLGHWVGQRNVQPLYREHWALRDVSFRIGVGEAVGILGRNGAGKSTLLQIIAGTLMPTTGAVQTSGRITALLELGSGFNPEFTGRENVLHNAQILGLSRAEIDGKLDDILAFADIGDFVDQPTKIYSSGMLMRLAFAVQTAVDPQILIVDEALSVGDMFFQAKCMARINALVDSGVTLLFVSHDIGSVRQLCSRALLIDSGRLVSIGVAATVSDQYLKSQLEDRNRVAKSISAPQTDDNLNLPGIAANAAKPVVNQNSSQTNLLADVMFGLDVYRQRAELNRTTNGAAKIVNVQMLRKDKHSIEFDYNEVATIRIFVIFERPMTNVNQAVVIRTVQGSNVVFQDTRLVGQMDATYVPNRLYCFQWQMRLPLMHQQYGLTIGLAHPPQKAGQDWEFIDSVPLAYEFKMNTRAEGMIDGYVSLPAELIVSSQEAVLESCL